MRAERGRGNESTSERQRLYVMCKGAEVQSQSGYAKVQRCEKTTNGKVEEDSNVKCAQNASASANARENQTVAGMMNVKGNMLQLLRM